MPSEIRVTVPGDPRSKSRPRFTGNGKVYSDKVQRAHEELLRWHFRMAIKTPWTGGVEVGMVFYRSNLHRIDLDNLVKAVLDAATGWVWVDDVQVVNLGARIELDRENPRTEVYVAPCSTSMPRGDESEETRECPTRGEHFQSRRYESKPDGQVYCSKACVGTAPIDCPVCGKNFKPGRPQQRYCGKKCAANSREVRAKIALNRRHAQLPSCRLCGAKLHRKEALLCRPCWLGRAPKGATKAEIAKALDLDPLSPLLCQDTVPFPPPLERPTIGRWPTQVP